jgi:PIN domain nuclease of toxin-antitoxin system
VQSIPSACVLDASALLAHARRERGSERVAPYLHTANISAVNWSEFLHKLRFYGLDPGELVDEYFAAGLNTVDFRLSHAELAAELWSEFVGLNISLADRACMALAIDLGLPILTADRRWTDLDLPIPVESIR